MSTITFRQVEREGARLVLGISGISGSGKTFTALQLAYGLAGYDARKVFFIDTENKRGSLYADALRNAKGEVQRFMIGDLYAPFSPQRYIDAILAAQQAGAEVLVIDSISHEWEGPGGCDEIANAGNPKTPRWNDAKREHKRFMTALLQCDMHVIACIRAREKVKIGRDAQGKTVIEPLGIMPICEKNFMFEMTASLMMWNEGQHQEVMKCPAELRGILGREKGYLTAADGAALRQWVAGGAQGDPEVESTMNRLRTVTEQGLAALQAAWGELPPAIKAKIGPKGCPDELKASAKAYDEQRALAAQRDGGIDELNQEVLG